MRAVIVGGGVGGLSAALALAQGGNEVVLLERAERFAEVGAGLQLSPNAVKALRRLGVAERLEPHVFVPEEITVRSAADGRALLRSPLGARAVRRWGAPYWQAHRADLLSELVRAAEDVRAIDLRLGAAVQTVVCAKGRGPSVVLASGEAIAADLVVACDGVRSTVRRAVAGPAPARFTGQTAWRGLVARGEAPAEAGVLIGRGRHLVYYPVRGGALMNFVAVTESSTWREESWSADGDPRELQAAFGSWPEPAAALSRAVVEVKRWALFDRPRTPSWTRDGVVLLGDAAHPMLPFLAQGAAMAVEDAVVLARCVHDQPSLPAALSSFVRARLDRTARVQAESRRNARLFHLPPPFSHAAFSAAALIDGFGAVGARFDWLYGYDAATAPI